MQKLIFVLTLFFAATSLLTAQNVSNRNKKKAMEYAKKADEILSEDVDNILSKDKSLEAIKYADKAIQLNPYKSEYYSLKGTGYGYLMDFQNAILYMDKAISLDSANYSAWMGKGIALERLKKYQEAEKCYKYILGNGRESAALYYNMGSMYVHWGKVEEGVEYFTKSIELRPEYKYAYINRGEANIRLQEYKKAIEDFNFVIERDTMDKFAYNNRGFCRLFTNENEGAIKDFKKALSIKSSKTFKEFYNIDLYCYNNIGNANYALGNTDEACKYWKLALEKGYKYDKSWKEIYKIEDPAILIEQNCK